MLLYYHSWMFYNHFIATLYHFLGLTYWRSAQCQLLFFACFLLRRKSISNGVQTPRNILENFYGPEHPGWAREVPEGCPEGGTTHLGAPGGQGAPWWVVPTSVASRTASLLYKYPENSKTRGSRRNTIRVASSRTTRSNLDTITEGFIILIGASPMMRE